MLLEPFGRSSKTFARLHEVRDNERQLTRRACSKAASPLTANSGHRDGLSDVSKNGFCRLIDCGLNDCSVSESGSALESAAREIVLLS